MGSVKVWYWRRETAAASGSFVGCLTGIFPYSPRDVAVGVFPRGRESWFQLCSNQARPRAFDEATEQMQMLPWKEWL